MYILFFLRSIEITRLIFKYPPKGGLRAGRYIFNVTNRRLANRCRLDKHQAMRYNLLVAALAILCFGIYPVASTAAARAASPEELSGQPAAHVAPAPVEQGGKSIRWNKRAERIGKKLTKKMERLQRKGKTASRYNVGFTLGLIVLLIGGLFIFLGIVIPVVGILFIVIGGIIAFVGLLLWVLLGGITVDLS